MSEGKEQEGWRSIDIREIDLGKQIGGGGAGVVHESVLDGEEVAVKALVRQGCVDITCSMHEIIRIDCTFALELKDR